MSTTKILLSGFGGQGILFAGKFLAYKGLMEGKEVSWLPSYGPEMRGGTASCSVIISDEPVGSPIVSNPDILIAMNLPSFDKFEPAVKALEAIEQGRNAYLVSCVVQVFCNASRIIEERTDHQRVHYTGVDSKLKREIEQKKQGVMSMY